MADDRYEVLSQLGRGNFGVVFLARHKILNRECALKVVPAHGEEVLDEARKLAALPEHDNVVKVLDAGQWDENRVFIASELCMEGSLADLADAHPLDPAAACGLLSDACRGLEHLHEQGMLHLDIRPANILLAAGRPRLADFGLARWKHDPDVDQWYGPHAAPELIETGRATPESDIYSMAMTIAHVLTGGRICRPFPTHSQLVQKSADGDWPQLEKLGPNVPPKLRKVIDRGTQYDPFQRPQPVAQFKRQLDRATPVVSFALADENRLESKDGMWSVETTEVERGRCAVEVRKNGRRRQVLCETNLTPAQARRTVLKMVKKLADS